MSTTKSSTTITMADVPNGQLFVIIPQGVLRKVGHSTGTHKNGKTHVVYPNEVVRLLNKKGA